jgi:hypothetical protein
MSLDIRAEIDTIKNLYKSTTDMTAFRALIFGDVGSGKTKLLSTCPRPIHIDSWDPGGTITLKKEIEEGWIVADTRWEIDDPDKPDKLVEFEKEFDRRRTSGYFNIFGTYALDSLTTFGDAAMNYLLYKLGRKDGIPLTGKTGDNDYVRQQKMIEPIIRQMLNLPCHVIIIAHPDLREDEERRIKSIGPKVYGQLATKLPLLFNEIYYATTQTVQNGVDYRLLTRQTGYYRCRSRLSASGQLEMYEAQNIKNILRKTGFNADDKPIPWLEKQGGNNA